ncbi:MAG: hypothetical protein AAF431_20050, partial [Pseudomonadota bacterium]
NYQCDIQRRESMIKELISAAGISDKDTLIADPLYSCLTSRFKRHLVSQQALFFCPDTPDQNAPAPRSQQY